MSTLFEDLIAKKKKGIFKIYLGYAAGVGKTYAMLKEGHRLKAQGIDIVLGYIEPHDRPQTTSLIEGLEKIPLLLSTLCQQSFYEMDPQAIIKRLPEIVLIDELAHSNFPGSKNQKRYQDVYEVLEAGINVISTLNVQHLESVADKVTEGTGVPVNERIPDDILRIADHVVLVDITMEDLRDRLRLGKIYPPEKAQHALTHFFTHENLSFLREICLREGAGDQVRKIEKQGLLNLTATQLADESVLAALSSNPYHAEALLKKATHMAFQLSTRCYAVYIQTKKESPLKIDATLQRQLQNNMKLAKSLGAEVITLIEEDIAIGLLNFAAQHYVKHAVFGKPQHTGWISSLRGNIIQRFLDDCIGIDVHIVHLPPRETHEKNIPHHAHSLI